MGAAEAKKDCDSKQCMEKITNGYKKCAAGCKGDKPEKPEKPAQMKSEKPSCSDSCEQKGAEAKKKCGDDEACMKKVSAMYKECSIGCKSIIFYCFKSIIINYFEGTV